MNAWAVTLPCQYKVCENVWKYPYVMVPQQKQVPKHVKTCFWCVRRQQSSGNLPRVTSPHSCLTPWETAVTSASVRHSFEAAADSLGDSSHKCFNDTCSFEEAAAPDGPFWKLRATRGLGCSVCSPISALCVVFSPGPELKQKKWKCNTVIHPGHMGYSSTFRSIPFHTSGNRRHGYRSPIVFSATSCEQCQLQKPCRLDRFHANFLRLHNWKIVWQNVARGPVGTQNWGLEKWFQRGSRTMYPHSIYV